MFIFSFFFVYIFTIDYIEVENSLGFILLSNVIDTWYFDSNSRIIYARKNVRENIEHDFNEHTILFSIQGKKKHFLFDEQIKAKQKQKINKTIYRFDHRIQYAVKLNSKCILIVFVGLFCLYFDLFCFVEFTPTRPFQYKHKN